MKAEKKITNCNYTSKLAIHLNNYVELQRKKRDSTFNTQARHLYCFDQFITGTFLDNGVLTTESIDLYIQELHSRQVSDGYVFGVVSTIRKFGEYLLSQGIEGCLYPKGTIPKGHYKIPYLPTVKEMQKFTEYVDKNSFGMVCSSFSMVFRLLCLTGMRIGEVLELKRDDISFEENTITVREGKQNKDRIVVLNNELTTMLKNCDEKLQKDFVNRDYMFPGKNGRGCTSTIYFGQWFKSAWKKCFNVDNPRIIPTPHSIRHAYVINIINLWSKKGIDFKSRLPVLSRYLGHSSVEDTYYYYHQLADGMYAIEKFVKSAKAMPKELQDVFISE